MALMFYSDLDIGRTDARTLDALNTVLMEVVRESLASAQGRSSRPVESFRPSLGSQCGAAEELALQMIQRVRHAQVQLLDRNAYLRYLCSSCLLRGHSACRAGNRSAVKRARHLLLEPKVAHSGLWAAQPLPTASRVVERLQAMAAVVEDAPASDEEARRRRGAFVDDLRSAANSWRKRGLADSAVDVDAEEPMQFYWAVTIALCKAIGEEEERTDIRHSPVNFIAEVLLTLAEQIQSPLAPPAREALMAALVARNAAIEGDSVAVDDFSRSWLGLSKPEQWRESVEMALLGNWVDALGAHLGDDSEVMDLLLRHSHSEHRHLQPLWERKVRGRRLRLLDDPVAEGVALRDIITDHCRPEDELFFSELEDARVLAVLRSLKPSEAAVAAVYGSSRVTWTQAAEQAGEGDPAAFGERVRKKLKRLGSRHLVRSAPAVGTDTGVAR
ncbi:hypothetical protein [Streptomyces sp. CB01881]|uniref:hypothetical protein n=1 Tax=Streptomyces sp. CB01881 TaxID=2078691 RepID=UPI000CDCA178|nr:hypothetical protein [Streptomyces sp. CB01881]AUY50952.1 hypothetical protein C2142_20655 [Streptomyces sp. CB01881]TYC74337.1 hypothetical protein EH183_20620 [Streptomyces sp. CB01881]